MKKRERCQGQKMVCQVCQDKLSDMFDKEN